MVRDSLKQIYGLRCGERKCEEEIYTKSKEESELIEDVKMTGSAKSLCIPLDAAKVKKG